uniref:PGG domain-containing protein n=2 Tax=Triticum urartu TaxID=4572 RepID=A0A8R7V0F6_TRIUA
MVGMFGLMGAYAAGSWRHLKTSLYVLTLVGAVLAFIASQVAIFWIIRHNQAGSPQADLPDRQLGQGEDGEADDNSNKEKYMLEYLMLLGILAASMTYQTGLKPPGGLWQDNDNGHSAGNPILHDINKHRYHAFFYSNSTSFMASIVVVVMLLPLTTFHNHNLPLWPMHTAILLDMFSLLVAYAAGSNRKWETSRNVILLIIPVLAYIAVYATMSVFYHRKDQSASHENTNSDASDTV